METIYEKLRERLNMFPQGFPKTESGVELDILKKLLTPAEADLMLHLRPYPELSTAIAVRAAQPEKEVGSTLYDLSKRGLILRFRQSAEEIYYFLTPWMVGIWEFQVNNLTPQNIELYEKFFVEGMVPERKKTKTAGFRVIPIEREIQGHTEIQPYEKMSEIINAQTRFAVAPCICRKEKTMLGEGCGKLLETCMMFGVAADYYIENGLGREIAKEEALAILEKTEEEGLVHCSSNHAGDKVFICNCCGCCCKALGFITKYNMSHSIAKSNYLAAVNEEDCAACETCLDRCQVKAITIEDDRAVVDKALCIGCGLCVSTCPTGAMSMIQKSSAERSPIFPDDFALLQAIGQDKGKTYPFE